MPGNPAPADGATLAERSEARLEQLIAICRAVPEDQRDRVTLGMLGAILGGVQDLVPDDRWNRCLVEAARLEGLIA